MLSFKTRHKRMNYLGQKKPEPNLSDIKFRIEAFLKDVEPIVKFLIPNLQTQI